jgi:hypothetical protein
MPTGLLRPHSDRAKMPEKSWIQQVVDKTVAEVLQAQVPRLQAELVRRVLAEIEPLLGGASPESTPDSLLKAIAAIHTGTTQREILRSLLDQTTRYCGRSALFVVKAGAATGWQARAFSNYEDIKDFSLDVSTGIAARAMQSRIPFAAGAADMDAKFVAKFGAPADDRVLVLPLLLKERVAALVYADPGQEASGKMDSAALELLVVSASAWLEVAASRKQTHKDGTTESAPAPRQESPAAAPVSSFADPFAAHAPMHTTAVPAAVAPESVVAVGAMAEAVSDSTAASATAAAPATDPFAGLSAEDAETHRKAQRFARLLVDEIKLYNQAKVAEGRKNQDLYDRLKEDIDKSRATYQKRYAGTAAADADYFNRELVRSMAEDDSSLMGANFQR